MCGIAGILSLTDQKLSSSLMQQMLAGIRHRGPDDTDVFLNHPVLLGHTRLSIHDITQAGHQPMLSFDRRWVIIFNGELYNYISLKNELHQSSEVQFFGESDTEVLVNAIALWGIDKALKKCVGMFAFAAYDLQTKQLYIARDRFGEKPLYYGIQSGLFAFSSELKALRPMRQCGWTFSINRNALATYMRYGYVPTPHSIYKDIFKLEAGILLQVSAQGSIQKRAYWDAVVARDAHTYTGSYECAQRALTDKLSESVRLMMASDVPLGAFLSGGIDSSLIVSLMQAQSSQKIKTFSIGFYEKKYNEAHHASAIARHLNTDHNELYVTDRMMLEVIPKIPHIYDEPFADSSQLPTYLVSQLARKQVTVALTGDAGDELFGGYNRYLIASQRKKNILDKAVARTCIKYMPDQLCRLIGLVPSPFLNLGDKLIKLKRVLSTSGQADKALYQGMCSQLYDTSFVLGTTEYEFSPRCAFEGSDLSFEEWMMFTDAQTYMTDDILTKVDRAAMSVSLETRVPFLDHRIFEFAWSLPMEYKIHQGQGKRILRDMLYQYVPQSLINRPKMGFGIPLASWLRGELKAWAADLLSVERIRRQGYLDADVVQRYWHAHQSGKEDWHAGLWNILMFQAWLDEANAS